MIISYLKFMRKWQISYKGKAYATAETLDEVLADAFERLVRDNKKYIWD